MGDLSLLPSKRELMDATLRALKLLGGQASTSAIDSKVAELMDLTREALEIEDDNSPGTAFSYRMRWVRTALREKGLLSNPTRGTWLLNETKQL